MATKWPVPLTAQPLMGQDVAPLAEADARARLLEAASTVVDRLTALAAEQVRKKKPIEVRWLEDLRAFQGLYEPSLEKLFEANRERSRAFVGMTRTKTNAWRARLSDLLFPADDRNWGINPTPVPELVDGAKDAADEAVRLHEEAEAAAEQANRAEAMGDRAGMVAALNDGASKGALAVAMAQREEQARAEMDVAKRRAEAMSREIDDQLTEARYPARGRDVIDDGVKLGVGVMKGPLTANRPRHRWKAQEGGDNLFALTADPDDRPEYRRVDPWAFFPDMNGATPEEWEFTFERHLPTAKELRKLTRTLGFDPATVRSLLTEEKPAYGISDDLNHLSQLRALQGEEAITGRYVLWEYRGALECDDVLALLRALNREADAAEYERTYDPLDEQMVVIYFCNGRVLKIDTDYVLDSGETLYSVFQFERGEGSVMSAIGVPRIMMNAQRALNGAWRMMLDNAALSTGPQVALDKTKVEPENGSWTMTPRKVWLLTAAQAAGNGSAPFQVFNIPSNQAQLAGIIELALKFIDEEVSLPLIAQGEQGQHVTQTMGGMSMLFNSANVVFRRVVKNWDDDLTTPVIRRAYDWNMQFSPKGDIKGDMQVEARGTSVLLVREIQSQQLMLMAQNWSQHPQMGLALKVYDVMRMAVQSLGINPDDALVPKDEFDKRMKAMADQAAGQQSPDIIRAEATVRAAEIQAQSRAADGQVQLQIAETRRETELIRLASESGIEIEKLKVMLASKKLEVDSAERKQAAEIGTERIMAAEARAEGREPTGSGGSISAGTTEAQP